MECRLQLCLECQTITINTHWNKKIKLYNGGELNEQKNAWGGGWQDVSQHNLTVNLISVDIFFHILNKAQLSEWERIVKESRKIGAESGVVETNQIWLSLFFVSRDVDENMEMSN